ncbi:MAG: GatB/YqeY domain-containing protein [Myxococcota bacterium]|nr:GatB/YqeY domain-containing protein [Myxococcota bacterium]
MLTDEIKQRMTRAMRDRDTVAKAILGLAMGEIQTAEARANRPLTDDEAAAVVRKLVKSNEETLGHVATRESASEASDSPSATLRREIEVLASLLPKALSAEALAGSLAEVADALRGAKTEGQAMGIAMKHLKARALQADAEPVREHVQKLRA